MKALAHWLHDPSRLQVPVDRVTLVCSPERAPGEWPSLGTRHWFSFKFVCMCGSRREGRGAIIVIIPGRARMALTLKCPGPSLSVGTLAAQVLHYPSPRCAGFEF